MLHKFFNHSRFESFTRLLNLYGFRRRSLRDGHTLLVDAKRRLPTHLATAPSSSSTTNIPAQIDQEDLLRKLYHNSVSNSHLSLAPTETDPRPKVLANPLTKRLRSQMLTRQDSADSSGADSSVAGSSATATLSANNSGSSSTESINNRTIFKGCVVSHRFFQRSQPSFLQRITKKQSEPSSKAYEATSPIDTSRPDLYASISTLPTPTVNQQPHQSLSMPATASANNFGFFQAIPSPIWRNVIDHMGNMPLPSTYPTQQPPSHVQTQMPMHMPSMISAFSSQMLPSPHPQAMHYSSLPASSNPLLLPGSHAGSGQMHSAVHMPGIGMGAQQSGSIQLPPLHILDQSLRTPFAAASNASSLRQSSLVSGMTQQEQDFPNSPDTKRHREN